MAGKSKTKQSRRSHGRRGRGRSHSPKNIPLAPTIGVGAGVGINLLHAYNMSAGKAPLERAEEILDQMGQGVYGYSASNNAWATNNLPRFWVPVAGGAVAHKLATFIGLNRTLAKSKLGFTI